MAQYRDPYSDQQPGAHNERYGDGPSYNPYDSGEPHQTYDQGGYDPHTTGGYTDDPKANPQGNGASYEPEMQDAHLKDRHPHFVKESQPQGYKSWRYGQAGGLWTRGSRGSCIGRFCCCTLLVTVFLVISIILALLMWVRPPDVVVGGIAPSTTEDAVQLGTGSITVNLGIDIAVANPNYFAVSFKSIDALAYYPINNTLIGTGNESGITFNANSQTNFTFPFSMDFSTNMTSSTEILTDLAQKCGVGGGAVEDITINLDITLGLRILFFVVYPVVNIPVSFACPISAADIESLLESIASSVL